MPACNKLKLQWVSDQLHPTLVLAVHLSISSRIPPCGPPQLSAAVALQASTPAALMQQWEHTLAATRQCSRLGMKPQAASAISRSPQEWWLPSSWSRSTGQTTSNEPWPLSCCAGRVTPQTGWVRLPHSMGFGHCASLTDHSFCGKPLPCDSQLLCRMQDSAKGHQAAAMLVILPVDPVAMLTAESEHIRHCTSQDV